LSECINQTRNGIHQEWKRYPSEAAEGKRNPPLDESHNNRLTVVESFYSMLTGQAEEVCYRCVGAPCSSCCKASSNERGLMYIRVRKSYTLERCPLLRHSEKKERFKVYQIFAAACRQERANVRIHTLSTKQTPSNSTTFSICRLTCVLK
jgi:hypothetical protein